MCGAHKHLFVLSRVCALTVKERDTQVKLLGKPFCDFVGVVADNIYQLGAVAAVKHKVKHASAYYK